MGRRLRRREFLKLLGVAGLVGAGASLLPPITRYVLPPLEIASMPRSQLVWEDCSPVMASELKPNRNYVFYYPLVDTPSIVIKLETPDGRPFRVTSLRVPANLEPTMRPPAWLDGVLSQEEIAELERAATTGVFYEYPEGVGPDGNIVAYNAICQHLGCPYPALKYYPPGTPTPPTNPPEVGERGGVLHCICHGSAYDPSRAALVLSPPTVKPQPAIILEWDPATDYLYANGMVGPTISTKPCNTCGTVVGDKVPIAEEREPRQGITC